MNEWKTVRLGDVCEKGSSNIAQNEIADNNGEYPIYGAAGFIKNVDFYKQDKPYIGIVKDGAGVGRVSVHPAKSSLIGTMQYIFPKENIDIKFLAEFLKYQNLSRFYTGATIPHIYFKDYQNIPLKLPSLQKQKHISAVLGKCAELTVKNKRILEKYDTLIKSRFIEMFGDIIQNTKNWELKSFTEIAKSRLGKMLDSKKQTGKEKYPYLANFNVQWFRFNLENLNEMDFSEADRIEFALKDGDLLVCEGGEVGRCAVWHNQIENCFFQKAVHRVRLNMDLVHPDYMAYWFKFRSDFNSFDDIVGSKATIAHLTGEKLKLLQIPVPPLSLQNDFASFVQQIDKSKFAVQKSLEKTETLYKSLMQRYFA